MLAQHDHVFEQTLQKPIYYYQMELELSGREICSTGTRPKELVDVRRSNFDQCCGKTEFAGILLGGRESSSQYAQKLCARYIDNPEWNISWNAGVEDIKHETAEEKKTLQQKFSTQNLSCSALLMELHTKKDGL